MRRERFIGDRVHRMCWNVCFGNTLRFERVNSMSWQSYQSLLHHCTLDIWFLWHRSVLWQVWYFHTKPVQYTHLWKVALSQLSADEGTLYTLREVFRAHCEPESGSYLETYSSKIRGVRTARFSRKITTVSFHWCGFGRKDRTGKITRQVEF